MKSKSPRQRRKARGQTNSRATVSRAEANKRFAKKIELAGAYYPDYVGIAVWYCEQVTAGHVPACKWEKLACQRFLDMRKEALSGKVPFAWSDAHVADVCDFAEKIPHTKGFTGCITLEPVQCWWLAGIFGFRERDTGLRWVRSASIWCPRKNGKTGLSVPIVLFCANCENEPGAEIVISAGSEAQAGIPYGAIRRTLELEPDLVSQYGARDTKDWCEFDKTGAIIKLAHARAKNLDGFNPHMVLAEELHAQAQDVIGVLKTAQGARRNPLWLSISTAGRDVNSPAYEDWRMCQAVLGGKMKAPRMFSAMYAGDEEDDAHRFSKATVEKLNPLYGVSLQPTAIDEEIMEARKSEAKLQEYRRTRMNLWSRAAGNLISVDQWDACTDHKLDLDTLKGFPLYVGLDLASRSDLNAAAFEVKVGECLYLVTKYWICERAKRLQDDRFADAFRAWHKEGWIDFTPGGFIDYRKILSAVLGILEGHNVVGVGLDDYQANLMASEIEGAGYRTFIVPKNARYLTQATEDLTARVEDPGLLRHDGNPVTSWCAGNVVGYWDANDNVLPKKEKPGSTANIDGIDAAIIANAIRIDDEAGTLGGGTKRGQEKPNPYLSRGLAGAA